MDWVLILMIMMAILIVWVLIQARRDIKKLGLERK